MADFSHLMGFPQQAPNHDILLTLTALERSRLQAVKKLQLKIADIEGKFYERVHELEKEFDGLFAPIFEQRRKILAGEVEPTAEEANFPLLHSETELALLLEKPVPVQTGAEKGIHNFWLNVLKSHSAFSGLILEHDEPILGCLADIQTKTLVDPPRFTVEFHFKPNEFFIDTVLKKTYYLQIAPTEEEGKLFYDGPEIVKVEGCEIDWNDGKDVTTKVMKKKQKRGVNAGKFLTKTVQTESFFNFFATPKSLDEVNEEDDEDADIEEALQADYELGQTLRDSVIPRAALYFTGEIESEDMYDYDGEDDEEDSLDDDEE